MSPIEQIQGYWTITELEVDGTKFPSGGGASITVTGDRFVTHSMGAVYEGQIEIDAINFDLIFTEGPEQGGRSLGIYTLSGDTWRICLTTTGGKRPATFATTKGTGLALETLIRGPAPQNKPDSGVLEGVPDPEIQGKWKMVECLRSGEPLPAMMLKSAIRQASEGALTLHFGPTLFIQANYKTNPNATPRTIDYFHTGGGSKGQRQLGIYKVEGGRLTHCFADCGELRPADFTSVPGDGRTLAVFLRQ